MGVSNSITTSEVAPMSCERRKRLAIVGTREPNPAQAERVREAARAALEDGWRIVTGGASGVDKLAVLGAQEYEHASDVTLVLPWNSFEHWDRSGDERILQIVFDPEGRADHREWLAELLRLLPSARTKSQGAVKCLARDIGIMRMADAVFAFPRADAPDDQRQTNLPEYALRMSVFRQTASHRDPEFGGGTGFAIRVARELGKPLWIDDGSAKPGTPFRRALVRDCAATSREATGA